jgi:hypothetical protein
MTRLNTLTVDYLEPIGKLIRQVRNLTYVGRISISASQVRNLTNVERISISASQVKKPDQRRADFHIRQSGKKT